MLSNKFTLTVIAIFVVITSLESYSDKKTVAIFTMPVGTPDMEVNSNFKPYNVLLLKSDGTHQVFANVQPYEEKL
jgi:hypothetical protein